MNKIMIFENEEFGKVRTVCIDGEPWFVAKMLPLFSDMKVRTRSN